MNFLEQLVAEWFEYCGYFVQTNVPRRKRPAGGRVGEFDVIAVNPRDGDTVHVETSGAAERADQYRDQIVKKFAVDPDEYEELIGTATVRRIAIVSFSPRLTLDLTAVKITVFTAPEFLRFLTDRVRSVNVRSDAIPEKYPRLRAIQMVSQFGTGRTDDSTDLRWRVLPVPGGRVTSRA